MNDQHIGIIGGGRITRIMLDAWSRSNHLPKTVVVSDMDPTVLATLQTEFQGIIVTKQNSKAAEQDIVLLALHPPAFAGCLTEIQASIQPQSIVISLAPKWSMNKISQALGGFERLVRIIPNAPSLVGQGFNPLSYSSCLSLPERQEIASLFQPLGAHPEVQEDLLEAYAIISAIGPTYFWYQFYQLIDLARDFGITQEAAVTAVSNMLLGAVKTMTESGLPSEAVMDLIPVRPLANLEKMVKETYRDTLSELFRKLKN